MDTMIADAELRTAAHGPTPTGVTNVHEARNALGKRLRELRQQANLSGRQLAESLSWPPSKVSKLENGRQTPTDDDIRGWTRATNSEGETEALIASLHTLEIQHAEWQRQLKTGLRPHQNEIAELDAKTRLFRAFESTVIPGLLHTAEYARARFAQGITMFKVRNDINEAVQARVRRQEILRNHVLAITRHQMKPDDAQRLNKLTRIKVTLLFTYSGIDDKQLEPNPSHVAAESLKLMGAPTPRRYRTILYWRPLVPGLNDTDEHLDRAYALSQHADATVFTGLFYRDQIAEYYRTNRLPEPYNTTARRKIVPETLEQRVLTVFSASTSLFRKTSCAVSYAHGLPDYNGHYGVRELCGICPLAQLDLCRTAYRVPTIDQLHEVARVLTEASSLVVVDITERAAGVSGLAEEQPRYYLQHALGFQVHDVRYPHLDGGMVGPTSDGGAHRNVTGWTRLRYVVVDVDGNGQQPPDLVELAVVPIVGGIIGEPSSWLVRPDQPNQVLRDPYSWSDEPRRRRRPGVR